MPHEPCLSEEQWAELRDSINQAILDGLDTPSKIEGLKIQIARLVSHVDSQRRVEDKSSKQLYEHHQILHGIGESDGLKGKVNELYKALATFRKVAWIGMSMMIVVFIKAIWEVVSKSGIKP